MKEKRLAPALAGLLDIQEEALSGAPRIIISGSSRVMIEGHRGLLEYSRERIAAAGTGCRVLVRGEELGLQAMDGRSLVITGRLWAVELE